VTDIEDKLVETGGEPCLAPRETLITIAPATAPHRKTRRREKMAARSAGRGKVMEVVDMPLL